MNIDGEPAGYRSGVGEEFIPPNYRRLLLPGYLTMPRRILYGAAPDRTMLNYRTMQLLNVLHSTELESFVTDLDERITYSLTDVGDFYRDAFTLEVLPSPGTVSELSLINSLGSADEQGIMQYAWTIRVTSASEVEVTRTTPTQASAVQEYTMTDGLSSASTLPGSGLQARFSTPSVGDQWSVVGLARPAKDLGQLLQELPSSNSPVSIELFGRGQTFGSVEPWPTFRNLWANHHELPYRLGAFLLAMIYRMERIRLE